MDAFYAAVEQRDDPALRGKPVIVGGAPNSRGVVSTCSYEARVFGVRSAMPSSQAYRLCPQAVFLRPRFYAYSIVSRQIQRIFLRYTGCIEPLSLDEAFLDLSEAHRTPLSNRVARGIADTEELLPAIRIAENIRRDIRQETGLTASAGVSYCKFLAKIASDINKPDGLAVIRASEAKAFLEALPVERFWGVGKATAKRLHAFGIMTGKDLAEYNQTVLMREFGKQGALLRDLALGRDDRAVESDRGRKSFGRETTFQSDNDDLPYLHSVLSDFVSELAASLAKGGLAASVITVKARYGDFSTETRSETLPAPTSDAGVFQEKAIALLGRTQAGKRALRLIGVSLSGVTDISGAGENECGGAPRSSGDAGSVQEDLPFQEWF